MGTWVLVFLALSYGGNSTVVYGIPSREACEKAARELVPPPRSVGQYTSVVHTSWTCIETTAARP